MAGGILIISHETPGTRMAGPAIRYWQLAQALAGEMEVTLAVPGTLQLPAGLVRVVTYERGNDQALRTHAAGCQVVLVAGFVLRHYPFLLKLPQPMVIDLYDPFVLENLAIHANISLPEQAAIHRIDHSVLTEQLERGDFFICASEQQRDFWLGMLTAVGRVNPYTFAADRTLRQLIDVVPFGVPDAAPQRGGPAIRGVVPGIAAGDFVVYWGGGLWDWFDPLTAIRAVAALAASMPRLRLFFAGVENPNPAVPPARQGAEAQKLSGELGLTGRHVFFNDWVPYFERGAFLLEADAGISLHVDQVETRFAYRTRLLDYVWAGLPMVITQGDTLAAQAAARGLAFTTAPGDVAGVAAALVACSTETELDRAARRARASALSDEWRWSRVVGPLLEFCRAPSVAADRAPGKAGPAWRPSLAAKAWQSLRSRGPLGLWQDVRLYLNL